MGVMCPVPSNLLLTTFQKEEEGEKKNTVKTYDSKSKICCLLMFYMDDEHSCIAHSYVNTWAIMNLSFRCQEGVLPLAEI